MENTINLEEIKRLSEITNFSLYGLEKDYHLTRILHKISEKRIKDLVFKGGTCLNKCYLGFYRLSEDLDFVYNQNVANLSRAQIKKVLDKLRRELMEILEGLGLQINKELGKGWKMLTSKQEPKIVGLEIITNYTSLVDNSIQTIKIEISFRKKLRNPTKINEIHHEFINGLGEPLLEKDVKIEVIDLSENLAEKFRALVTRKNIAIRDIYDIHFILKKNIIKLDKEFIELILIKINESNETKEGKFTKDNLIQFIEDLKLSSLNQKELVSVLRSSEGVDVNKMIKLIIISFRDFGETVI